MKHPGIAQPLGQLTRVVALSIAATLLAWISLTFVKLRTPRRGMLWLIPKVAAASFSEEIAAIGILGAAVGAITASFSGAIGCALVALVAAVPVWRTWRTPEVLSGAFAGAESIERNKYLLQRRWGVHLGAVPQPRVRRDVAFCTLAELPHPLLCDMWKPATHLSSGLGFIYLHGSAWTLLDKDCGTRPLFAQLAAQGHVVMDVAYRMYPETDMLGMLSDAKRAISWLKAHAADYGVDPARIVIGGGSAGGHLALLAAYTNRHPQLTPPDLVDADTSVCGVLGWYSPVDLGACYEHYENARLAVMTPEQPDWNAPPPPMMRRLFGADAERLGFRKMMGGGRLDWILEGTPETVRDRYTLFSPISHVSLGCPPTLLMQGRDDIIVPPAPALEIERKLHAAGVEAAVLLLPQADHAFDLVGTAWSPMARHALWHAERFLALLANRPLTAKQLTTGQCLSTVPVS